MRKLLLGLIGLLFAIPAVADLDPCRNLFDSTPYKTGYYINESGVEQSANVEQYIIRQAVVQPGTQYTLSFVVTQAGYTQRYHAYDANDNWLSQVAAVGGSEVVGTKVIKTFTTPANTKYIRQGGRSQSEYQLELGSTATEYVPYCANPIKIATTKYNAARFSPVVTELNDTIATIRSVVTNTINQTKAIADLQATKQTRPNENCPAGKKCLLVEDNDGTPHWYEIIESASRLPDGFKELEYIESTGTQYIDTGYSNINAAENTYDLRFAVVSFSASFGFYGAPTTSQDNRTCMLWSNTNGTLQVSSGTTTSSSSEYRGNYTLGVPQTKVINCNNITRRYSVDGTGNYAFNGSSLNENTIQFGLSTQNGNVRYYYFKIYDNNTLVRDFIPARRERDGVIGMYDLADNNPATAFHTNAGTGTFVEGPEI